MQGTAPNKVLEKFGVTEQGINDIFNKYGNSLQAKAVLGMLGTSPEQLKSDALSMLNGGEVKQSPTQQNPTNGNNLPRKFPRLK